MVMSSLFPTWWKARLPDAKQEQQSKFDWLMCEVDEHEIHRMPVLHDLSGWRNREVYEYIQASDWTAIMFEDHPL